jgi:tripartite-type tricarboxylate transporter receptor subunit TctC
VLLVAPFSAGGAADIAARTLAHHAGRHLPNPAATIVVENRTGASGAVGTQSVLRARPDGHTLLLARIASAAILPATDPRTPYAWDDFAMLGLLDENPYVVAVRADAPWRTLQELLAALRERPRSLTSACATCSPRAGCRSTRAWPCHSAAAARPWRPCSAARPSSSATT